MAGAGAHNATRVGGSDRGDVGWFEGFGDVGSGPGGVAVGELEGFDASFAFEAGVGGCLVAVGVVAVGAVRDSSGEFF